MRKCFDLIFYRIIYQQKRVVKTNFFRLLVYQLIAQFKKQILDILYILQIEKYMFANA